jgi:hypothetical protein
MLVHFEHGETPADFSRAVETYLELYLLGSGLLATCFHTGT